MQGGTSDSVTTGVLFQWQILVSVTDRAVVQTRFSGNPSGSVFRALNI